MTDRLSSGSDRLDAVLGGGLPRNGIVLIGGNPGSGKTILAQQYVFHNASTDRPAVYLTTVSEPREDPALRPGLDFFDPAALGTSVIYEDLGRTLNDDGLSGALAYITELLKQHRPGLVVIDSFRALQTCSRPGDVQGFLHELAGRLSALPITFFWVGEYSSTDTSDAPEFAVADAIVSLGTDREAERDRRVLSVIKLRGSGSARASTPTGSPPQVSTCSRAWPTPSSSTAMTARRNACPPAFRRWMPCWLMATTAVPRPCWPALRGSARPCSRCIIFAGIQRGETGVIATFQENPTQLERILKGFSWSLDDPGVELMYRSPVDLYLTNGSTTCWTPCTAPAPPESPSTVSATWQPHPAMNSASASTSTPYCNAAPAPTSALS